MEKNGERWVNYAVNITSACASARLVTWLIDCSATVAMVVAGMWWLGGTTEVKAFILQTNYGQLALILGVPVVVHTLVMGLSDRTIGMWATDLQLLQAEGDPVDWGNVARRPLGVLLLPLTFALLGVVPLLNEHRRTITDFISGTRVVDTVRPGQQISFDTWRIFKGLLRLLAPVSVALAIGALVLMQPSGLPVKVLLLDAVVVALTGTLLVVTLVSAGKVKLSRVRVDARGILRSGLLGWANKPVGWKEIDHARILHGPLFSYFEVYRKSRRKFRVPLERHVAQLMANEFARHGVRIEP